MYFMSLYIVWAIIHDSNIGNGASLLFHLKVRKVIKSGKIIHMVGFAAGAKHMQNNMPHVCPLDRQRHSAGSPTDET